MATRRQVPATADVAASPVKSESPSKSDVSPAVPAYVSSGRDIEMGMERERERLSE